MRYPRGFIHLLGGAVHQRRTSPKVAALLPHRGSSSYSGSKAALEMITDTLRLELAPWEADGHGGWMELYKVIDF